MTVLADNRTARYRYFIIETVTAGMVLTGTEVKSIRAGHVQLRDAFVRVFNDEPVLLNCHIAPYTHGNIMNHDPLRTRKLLLRKVEIKRLVGKVEKKGLTLVPLKLFLKRGFIKVEIALAKGKEEHDKRDTIRQREADREVARALRGRE